MTDEEQPMVADYRVELFGGETTTVEGITGFDYKDSWVHFYEPDRLSTSFNRDAVMRITPLHDTVRPA